MLTIRDETAIVAVTDPDLRDLLTSRLADLTQGESYDPDVHGLVMVMAPDDPVAEIEAAIGFPLLRNSITGVEYGDPEFSPIFEFVGQHARWYEVVIVPGDGDFGIVLFVPRHGDTEPRLLSLCAEYAVTEPAAV